ncbi:hypothetical protein KSP40_PGU011479 [Platanthera guangdongensis]|uniref:DDE Tnp4 domain-containing protein n=1 Tax=Platanthera guangdongensis TaxID=2320717 RepID=A0ABR2M649_9ASPA
METISRLFMIGLCARTSLSMNRREIFNKAHSSFCSVIKRSFGVCKKNGHMLSKMSSFDFSNQCVVVLATMTLHNFIRRYSSRSDPEFDACDGNKNFVHAEAYKLQPTNRPSTIDANLNIESSTFERT